MQIVCSNVCSSCEEFSTAAHFALREFNEGLNGCLSPFFEGRDFSIFFTMGKKTCWMVCSQQGGKVGSRLLAERMDVL